MSMLTELDLYEDDIAVDQKTKELLEMGKKDSYRGRRAATSNISHLWPYGGVPYAFNSSSEFTRKFGALSI